MTLWFTAWRLKRDFVLRFHLTTRYPSSDDMRWLLGGALALGAGGPLGRDGDNSEKLSGLERYPWNSVAVLLKHCMFEERKKEEEKIFTRASELASELAIYSDFIICDANETLLLLVHSCSCSTSRTLHRIVLSAARTAHSSSLSSSPLSPSSSSSSASSSSSSPSGSSRP